MKERQFIITEIELDNKIVAWHYFKISNYKEITSYSAFFHSTKRRNWTKTKLYIGKNIVEHTSEQERWSKTNLKYKIKEKIKKIKHNSIWDFYKFIGYDYKKRKYQCM